MTTLTPTPLPDAIPADADLAEQANPGHGIPSHDPDLSAQAPMSADETARETQSALVGGGVVAGAAAGAAIGVIVSGPVGVVVGSTIGAVAGALGASAAGTTALDTDKATPPQPYPGR